MRVLHILQYSLPFANGYSIRASYITGCQHNAGLNVFAVTSARQPDPVAEVDTIESIDIRRTMPINEGKLPIVRELKLMRALYETINTAVAQWRPDIVHAHSPMLVGLPALMAARKNKLPLVYEVRDLWENAAAASGRFAINSPQYRLARAAEGVVFKRADAIVTICESMRAYISPRVAKSIGLSTVLNGVQIENFTPSTPRDDLKKKYGISNKRVFGFLGSFEPWEGLTDLIKAVPHIVAAIPDAHLLVTGGGHMEQAIRDQIVASGVQKHVTLTGRVAHDEVRDVLALNELLVYPRSRSQVTELTTPIKPLEAMAMARPILVSDVGGLLELIEPEQTGISFESGNEKDLAKQVIRLLNDAPLRTRLGNQAREYVARERDWPGLVDGYRSIYAQAIQNNGSRNRTKPRAAVSEQ